MSHKWLHRHLHCDRVSKQRHSPLLWVNSRRFLSQARARHQSGLNYKWRDFGEITLLADYAAFTQTTKRQIGSSGRLLKGEIVSMPLTRFDWRQTLCKP